MTEKTNGLVAGRSALSCDDILRFIDSATEQNTVHQREIEQESQQHQWEEVTRRQAALRGRVLLPEETQHDATEERIKELEASLRRAERTAQAAEIRADELNRKNAELMQKNAELQSDIRMKETRLFACERELKQLYREEEELQEMCRKLRQTVRTEAREKAKQNPSPAGVAI